MRRRNQRQAAVARITPQASPLTARQREILDHLVERERAGAPPPGLDQLCAELGLSSRGSLHKQITALVDAGLVAPMAGRRIGIQLTPDATNDGTLPLVGQIAAGRPIQTFAHDRRIDVPGFLHSGADCYVVQVSGDSMMDAGILDGDYVVIEARETARNGEMVVALVDESEVTLKFIEQRPGKILLHAANAALRTQVYDPDRVRIQGVVVGQMRAYR